MFGERALVHGHLRIERKMTELGEERMKEGATHCSMPDRPPENDGRKADETRAEPHGCYEHHGAIPRHLHGI